MIFVVFNIILAIVLIRFSIFLDTDIRSLKSESLSSIALIEAGFAFLSALIVFFVLTDKVVLAGFVVRLFLLGFALLQSFLFLWTLVFPEARFKRAKLISEIVIFLLLGYICFLAFRVVRINSIGLITLQIAEFNFTQPIFLYFMMFFGVVLPIFSIFILLFKYELVKKNMVKQQILGIVFSILLGIVLFFTLFIAVQKIEKPLFLFLLPAVFFVVLYLIDKSIEIKALYTIPLVLQNIALFVVRFFLPALLGGLLFFIFSILLKNNPFIFWSAIALVLGCLFIGFYFLQKKFAEFFQKTHFNYAENLEIELAQLNFENPEIHTEEVFAEIMCKNLDIENISFLIEHKGTKFITQYTNANQHIELNTNNPVFSSLLNIKRRIIFRTQIDSDYELFPIRRDLTKLFDYMNAEGLILLNEGMHLFALIVLGKKNHEKVYTNYDYDTLSNLYSWFFLAQFYLKNLSNKTLVGTVDREIQLSSQIIQSIQQNNEPIVHSEYDVQSLSKSARSLGGEFVDFVRIDSKRHIVVIGDISGRGLNAAMSMVIVKAMIRSFLSETSDFKLLVEKVNTFILENLPRGTYFAGMFCLVDMAKNMLYYINCALPALLLYTKSYNNVVEIQGEGHILGFYKDIASLLKIQKMAFSTGNIFIALTDGLINGKSLQGEPFGKNRIQNLIVENTDLSAKKICALLYDEVQKFSGLEAEDDMSCVVFKTK